MHDDTFLSVHEAAHFLHLSHRTLENWRQHKRGPGFFKVANKVLYKKSDLIAWVESQNQTSDEGGQS